MKNLPTILLSILLTIMSGSAAAFDISGNKWFGAKAVFHIDLAGVGSTGISFNNAFNSAVQEWNSKTPFTFSVVKQNRNPCLNDGLNSVDFATSFCGSDFGEKTLAIATRRFRTEVLGPPSITQADIIINTSRNQVFNVYDGKLIQFGIAGLDLKRIAVHELGHALGLEHSQIQQAIMAPTISDVFTLHEDDIKAVETLYGGLSNCQVKPFNFGLIKNALDSNDCTVNQLTLTKSDSSPIDLYRFEIASTTTFNFTMTSTTLDSVLLVADADLRIIAFDNKSGNQCNSTLNTTLQPGKYFLLANTYDEPVKQTCGISGSYQIATSFSSNSFLAFNGANSLSGGPSFGAFSGGITANNGISYGNQFKSSDTIDISASIVVDTSHQGKPGFLVVGALFDGEIHLLNAAGKFVLFNSNSGVIEKARSKVLSAREDIQVVSRLVPASLGISSIVVDFVVGYGLDSNPAEVYFHATPLNLTVSP